ncbi:Protein CBG01892 [Caenorhabditis briggsae]|nr:Protein CBG01892 [Caenorhabditis briggsae]CAP23092.2 Protein CBG01892 [Caenorhabditis briggsae]
MGSMPTNSNNPPVRTVTLNATVARMLGNNVIYSRYPEFYQFLATDQPTWFVPQPLKGTVFHVNDSNITKIPEFHAVDRMMRENQARIKELQSYCIRVKKSYKEQLRRIRSEKVDHESVIEKAQELLINRLINRVSQMTEAKRYFKESIECIYNNEFHDTNLKEALRAVFSPNTDPTDTSTQLDSPNPMVRPDRSALQSSNRTPHAQSSEITLPTFSQPNRQESSHHSSHRNSLQSPADLEGRIYVRVRSARSGELAESNEN